jgi:CRP/FNR family transcriptional regulator
LDIHNTIKKIDFFRSLTDSQIDMLCDMSCIRSFSKDTIIYYESDIDFSLHFLVSGLVKIYKIDKYGNEIFLYYIYKNNMISELTSVDKDTIYCFSNASFVENGDILSINFQKFNEKFLDTDILTKQFIKEILQKSHQLQSILNRELVFDATAKVANMLCKDLKIFNGLKKTQIAFMLHIQPETLSRVLKRFTRDNLIINENKEYKILDETRLFSIFQGIGL